ncbi:hypothetical protein Sjap_004316 [Stephania japonica]|uniref:Uncharacterized protein n=1 Tax=Stephania japonica TaxID=461633 RepID=A0AAP0PGX3_9MAGN
MGPSAPPASSADCAGVPPVAGQRAIAPLSGCRRGGGMVANHPFPPLSMVHMRWGKRSLLVGLPPPSPTRMGLPCGATTHSRGSGDDDTHLTYISGIYDGARLRQGRNELELGIKRFEQCLDKSELSLDKDLLSAFKIESNLDKTLQPWLGPELGLKFK